MISNSEYFLCKRLQDAGDLTFVEDNCLVIIYFT